MKIASSISACAVFATAAVAQHLSGSGQIYLLNSTNLGTATMSQIIGCLDATGAFTQLNCATFNRLSDYPRTLYTSVGNCSFSDASQPANTDNAYGSKSYAWHCRPDYVATIADSAYPVAQSKDVSFLCHGDEHCFYDVKYLPSNNVTRPVWDYVWGSRQPSIPTGHTKVVWYWKKTN
ncbi:hypothetical protein M426DRAFT_323958 [Hypoxylon sp. CI-4A]|nr:hypothetical protein M426DRAFT_323958 [Hypoxylon sp. CI-4A]